MNATRRKVLVTGSAGILGSATVTALRSVGVDVVGFDVADGDDLLDVDRLVDRSRGCSAVAHLAAVPTDVPGEERNIGAVNVLGTWNVVLAAEQAGVERIVFSSSVNAIGVFMGQGDPERFPIDDRHGARPVTPYSVAKLASEEILAAATRRSQLTTLCLRFPALLHPSRYAQLHSLWQGGIAHEVSPYWEFGAYLDIRDAATAVARACVIGTPVNHDRMILVDDRPADVAPLSELIDLAVPPASRAQATTAATRGNLVDGSRGSAVLGARPEHHWADEVAR